MQALIAQGPAEGSAVRQWAMDRMPDFWPGRASFEAVESRTAELGDQSEGGWENRGSRFHRATSVIESVPAAGAVFLPLGEQLYDAGAMNGPYDDAVDQADLASDGLMQYDPGPQRLDRLITLTLLAEKRNHPRAAEWRSAAERGVATLSNMRMGPVVQRSLGRLR